MRKLSLLLCVLSCMAGLMLLKDVQPVPAPAATPQPSVVVITPAPDTILVETVAVATPVYTAIPVPQRTIQVYAGGKVTEQSLEEYLIHVVAGEMPAAYEPEALRAQAVAARSYIAWKMPEYGGGGCSRGENADICTDSTHCMAYKSEKEMQEDWGEDYAVYYTKIAQAVRDTAGQVLIYDGKPVQALFHASSGGRTEDAQAVWGTALPYLTSVSSGEEDTQRTQRMSKKELAATLNRAFPGAGLTAENVQQKFTIRSATPGGRADAVRVGKVTTTGRAVRSALGLSSTAFTVQYDGDTAILKTEGYGHGVGMSQDGANTMAQEGKNWQEILTHYYTGVEIGCLR